MRNVVYCIGNIEAKRKDFRAKGCRPNSLFVDNDEVALDFVVDNNSYFVTTKLPFAKFSVYQYIVYQTSLTGRSRLKSKQVKQMLKSVGAKFSISDKVGSLSKIEYRQLVLAYKMSFNTLRVYLNCDGIEYNKKNSRQLYQLLNAISSMCRVFVSVSDTRFTDELAELRLYNSDGQQLIVPATYQRARTVDIRFVKGVIKNKNIPINIKDIKSVVRIVGT